MRVGYKPYSNSMFYYLVGHLLCQWCSNHDCPNFYIILYTVFVFIFQQFFYLVTQRQETQATLEVLIQTVM